MTKIVDYDKFIVRPKDTVKYAFTSGGIDYFEFEDPSKLPVLRAEAYADIRRQEANRVDDSYLADFETSLEDALNKGELVRAAQILHVLKERRTFISNIGLRYQYLAVIYFSYDENQEGWSDERADKKIKHWMQSCDIESFFLKTHLNSLAFFYSITTKDFLNYTRWELKQIENHYNKVLLQRSLSTEALDIDSIYQLRIKTLQEWRKYVASL